MTEFFYFLFMLESAIEQVLFGVLILLSWILFHEPKEINSTVEHPPIYLFRKFTLDQLKKFDGKSGQTLAGTINEKNPDILIAIRRKVYNVSVSSNGERIFNRFYGPGT